MGANGRNEVTVGKSFVMPLEKLLGVFLGVETWWDGVPASGVAWLWNEPGSRQIGFLMPMFWNGGKGGAYPMEGTIDLADGVEETLCADDGVLFVVAEGGMDHEVGLAAAHAHIEKSLREGSKMSSGRMVEEGPTATAPKCLFCLTGRKHAVMHLPGTHLIRGSKDKALDEILLRVRDGVAGQAEASRA